MRLSKTPSWSTKHLNGAFQSFSIARRDASGRFVNDCAPDAQTALRILSTPLPTATKEER